MSEDTEPGSLGERMVAGMARFCDEREAQFLFDWRTRLQALGLPADDLDDEAVQREARLRTRAERINGCRLLPGSFDKRFTRDLPSFLGVITPKQEAMIDQLWYKYRKQLGHPNRTRPR
jgi:hypothetical protein